MKQGGVVGTLFEVGQHNGDLKFIILFPSEIHNRHHLLFGAYFPSLFLSSISRNSLCMESPLMQHQNANWLWTFFTQAWVPVQSRSGPRVLQVIWRPCSSRCGSLHTYRWRLCCHQRSSKEIEGCREAWKRSFWNVRLYPYSRRLSTPLWPKSVLVLLPTLWMSVNDVGPAYTVLAQRSGSEVHSQLMKVSLGCWTHQVVSPGICS